jgi:soluble lytic murein transglycosylase-like protein
MSFKSRWLGRALLAALLGGLSAKPAVAQIYSWRDARGTLVLSDRPLDPSAVTYHVASASNVRVTRKAGTPVAPTIDLHIVEQAERHSLRADLVRAVIQVESAFNPLARSSKGAMGLMQLMPATAAEFGVRDPWDPGQNIRGGAAYLRHLLDRYEGNEELALAAYNAGPTAIDRYGQQVPPYRETRQYVRRVRAASPPPAAPSAIYKRMVDVNGRLVPHYSNEKPPSGEYEVVSPRQ